MSDFRPLYKNVRQTRPSDKAEFRREQARLDRKAPRTKLERKTLYERLLDKHGIGTKPGGA